MAYVGTPRFRGNDLETLASIIQGEAGGEGLLGMQAVADVIRNRASQNFSGYGSDPLSQALARNQFQGQSSKISPEALAVAEQLKAGNLPSVTNGAVYYANPGDSTASWARRLNDQNALKIGNHYFTNNAEGQPFTASPYAGMADGPKGQESYPPQPAASPFGTMAPPRDNSIDPNVAQYAFAEDRPTMGNRLANAGKMFSQAMQAPKLRPGPFPGGPSAEQANGLLKATGGIQQLAQMLMQRRIS